MIKSFFEYIREDTGDTLDASKYAEDVINMIKSISDQSDSYALAGKKEYTDPYQFDLLVEVKLNPSPNFETDEHFKSLPWEELNFNKYGFSIDANTNIDNKDTIIPNIVITLILDPNRDYLEELKFKLIDIITHEINHINQIGWNRRPFKERPSSNNIRSDSKSDYKYFLLPDEVESMVKGMYERSKEEGVDINMLFDKYLIPFIKNGTITEEEYSEVFKKWLIHALEKYPDVDISFFNPKINKIVHSL